jgi:hypothetical protein
MVDGSPEDERAGEEGAFEWQLVVMSWLDSICLGQAVVLSSSEGRRWREAKAACRYRRTTERGEMALEGAKAN